MTTGVQTSLQYLDANNVAQQIGALRETPPALPPYLAALSAPAGSGGQDWSVNAPIPPLIGATVFGGSSPYAAWVILQTVPANYGACERRIVNNSGFTLLVAFDDGLAGVGSTPTNSHLFLLSPASSASPNDATVVTDRFKGRIRVFCVNAEAWVAILET